MLNTLITGRTLAMYKFIETFFFISLLITFILLCLLFYHFKQRLMDVEHKTCRMFEIVENVVKELTWLKCICASSQPSSHSTTTSFPQVVTGHTIRPQTAPPSSPSTTQEFSKIVVSDDDTSYTSDDEEEDESDYSVCDGDETDSEDGNSDNSYGENIALLNIDTTPEETAEIAVDKEIEDDDIQVIEREDIPGDGITLDVVEENPVVQTDSLSNVADANANAGNTMLEEQEVGIQNADDESEPIQEIASVVDTSSIDETAAASFQKLSLRELKTLLVSKGIVTDPSKYKKHEILKMLSEQQHHS